MASLAALGLLIQQIGAQWIGAAPTHDYTIAGVLGIILFVFASSARPGHHRRMNLRGGGIMAFERFPGLGRGAPRARRQE